MYKSYKGFRIKYNGQLQRLNSFVGNPVIRYTLYALVRLEGESDGRFFL